MLRQTAEKLICTTLSDEKKPCHGSLKVSEDRVPVRTLPERPDEILEGVLACTRCGAIYPIICGVGLIIDMLGRWLRETYIPTTGIAAENGGVSREMELQIREIMLLDVKKKGESLIRGQVKYNEGFRHHTHKNLASYIGSHFDWKKTLLDYSEGLATFLTQFAEIHPHKVTDNWLRDFSRLEPKLGIDLGCAVGGFTARLADHCDFAIGFDLSFEQILTARRILLHSPSKKSTYRVYTEGDRFREEPVEVDPRHNLDFVLAAAENIPLVDSSAAVSSSCNIVDIVMDPGRLVREQTRMLPSQGLLILTTPYLNTEVGVRENLAVDSMPADKVRSLVANLCEIVAEKDDLPWVLRHYNRKYEVFADHCLAAQKR